METEEMLADLCGIKAGLGRLKTELENLENKLRKTDDGDDEIFLLSIMGYEKYKDVIPVCGNWWWLRSPGCHTDLAARVLDNGWGDYYGYFVANVNAGVRPALRLNDDRAHAVGERVVVYDFPWIVIDSDEGFAIAEVPIGFHRFDEESNDYASSEIRQFLKDWAEERKEK